MVVAADGGLAGRGEEERRELSLLSPLPVTIWYL